MTNFKQILKFKSLNTKVCHGSFGVWKCCFPHRGQRSKGFTLIEILVSMGIIALISTVALNIFYVTVSSYEKSNSLLELEANGERVLSVLSREIRAAKSVIAYENYSSCTTSCSSDWLLIQRADNSSSCIYYGLVSAGVGEPDLWGENGYVFREELNCPADPATFDGTPGPGAVSVSNRNATDPRNGINVTGLTFLVNRNSDIPANMRISLDLRQGVTGNGTLPPPQSRVTVSLETTTSLR